MTPMVAMVAMMTPGAVIEVKAGTVPVVPVVMVAPVVAIVDLLNA
jgi:hypothetical protein